MIHGVCISQLIRYACTSSLYSGLYSQLIHYACTRSLYSGLYFTTHTLRVHQQFVLRFVFHNASVTLARGVCIQVCISQLIRCACTRSLYSGLYFTTHTLRLHEEFVFRFVFHNSYFALAQGVCIQVCISQPIRHACTSSLYSGLYFTTHTLRLHKQFVFRFFLQLYRFLSTKLCGQGLLKNHFILYFKQFHVTWVHMTKDGSHTQILVPLVGSKLTVPLI